MERPSEIIPLEKDARNTCIPRNSALTVDVVADDTFLSSLRDEWNELVAKSNASVYQSFEWSWLWWCHLGRQPNRKLHILTFHHHEIIVGIAPLFVEHVEFWGLTLHRRLSFLGTGTAFHKSYGLFLDDGPSDYLDLIALPGYEIGVGLSLTEYLRKHQDLFDEAEFLNAHEKSIVMNVLVPQLQLSNINYRKTQADISSQVILPDSLTDYLRGLSTNVRRRLSQAQQAYRSKNIFQVKEVTTQAELKISFDELVELHQRRWNDMGYPGYFSNKQFLEFQQSVAAVMLEKQCLWFKTTWADGHCIGARLGYKFNNSIYDYLTGFDKASAVAKYRPGYALLFSMIEDAINSRCTSVELLRGDERYKSELNPTSFRGSNIVIHNIHPSGSIRPILYAMMRIFIFVWFIISRESALLRVQYIQHGIFTFLYHWSAFRVARQINKVAHAIEQPRGTGTSYHEDLTFKDLINLIFSRKKMAGVMERPSEPKPFEEAAKNSIAALRSTLTVDVVSDDASFWLLRNEWIQLAQQSNTTVFQSFEWLSLWWKHFRSGKRQQLHIITFRREGRLVGIAPMFLDTVVVFGYPVYRRLAMIGSGISVHQSGGMLLDNGPSDYLDVLALPSDESEVAKAFWLAVNDRRDVIDEIEFVNVPEESIIRKYIILQAPANEWTTKTLRADVCPKLIVNGSFETYLKSLRGKFRRQLLQARRASHETLSYTLNSVTSADQYRVALLNIIELHQKRRNRAGYPGLFDDTRFQSFQEDVMEAFRLNGWLWCKTARVDGAIIAARLGFRFKHRYYDYLSGFDDAASESKRSPGLVLVLQMVEDAIRDDAHTIDFLRGDEPYKFDFTDKITHNWNSIIRRTRPQGIRKRLLHLIASIMKLGDFLAHRERTLLTVQLRTHRYYDFLFHYGKFRLSRLSDKLLRILGHSQQHHKTNWLIANEKPFRREG